MAKLYFDLIKRGLRVIDDVPARWRDEVKRLIENDDALGNGGSVND